MIHYHIEKPPLWKTIGSAVCVCFIGLFVCVYLLFSGIKTHEEQLRKTEYELQQTQLQLEHTRRERAELQWKVSVLESLEVERGNLLVETTENQ